MDNPQAPTNTAAIFEGINVKKRGKHREDKAAFDISRRLRRITPTPTPETITDAFQVFCEANNLDFDESIWATFDYINISSACIDAIDRATNNPWRPTLPEGIPHTESSLFIAAVLVYLAEASTNGDFYLSASVAAGAVGQTPRHCRRIIKTFADSGFITKRSNAVWNPSDPTLNKAARYACKYAEKGQMSAIPRSLDPTTTVETDSKLSVDSQERNQELVVDSATLPGIPQPRKTGNLGTSEAMIAGAVTETKPGPLGVLPMQETIPEPPTAKPNCAVKEKTNTTNQPTVVQPSSKQSGNTDDSPGRPCPECGKNAFDHTGEESDACWKAHQAGYKAAKPKGPKERFWAACRKAKHASDAAKESKPERTKRQATIYAKFLGDTKAGAVKQIVAQINQHGIKKVFATVGEILTDSGIKTNPIGLLLYKLKNNAEQIAV